jgi:hypothetical protein
MEQPMEFQSAPEAHLRTWSNVVRLITVSCICIAVLLIFMAVTLL